jgi:hypothetical protein
MNDIGHTFECVDPFAHSIEFHGTDINQVILQIKPDGTVLWKGREVESDADFRAAMMEVHQHMCGSANAEITCLRADLAQRTAERDAARLEIVDALKEMHTTAGLRRELKRRGWAEWYMEVKP